MITHRIGGRPWSGTTVKTGPVFDPATGKVADGVALASAAVVDEAVAAALAAYQSWSATSLGRRQQILFRFRQLLSDHVDDLARVIVAEHGKTLSDAIGEVRRGLEVVEYACAIPDLLKGEHSENVSTGVDTFSVRRPLGVVAGITPFNFPVMVPLWMFPIAIACGNTFVLKPSEKDPSGSVLAAELFGEAGLPGGVLNVVHGEGEAVDRLLEHPDVVAVSFVGSTAVARHVYETGARHGKRVQALGGAKNHLVALPDADPEAVADAAVSAAFGSAGERCMAISVLVVVGSAADRVLPAVTDRMAALRIGPGSVGGIDLGPLVTSAHRDRVTGLIDSGVASGAALVVDGRRPKVDGYEDGFYVGPTLFDRVSPGMRIYDEEIFGPVLSVVRVDTLEEAIHLINENPYGNGASIFTSDGAAARAFRDRVLAGMVGVNVPIPVPVGFYSFGGWKSSLFGDHAMYGPDGVHFFTRQQVVVSRWAERRGVDLGFPATEA